MIHKIQLLNFQIHKSLTIECGNVTTILGESDAGKSSVIRALKWITTNRPGGTSFIRHGAKKCSVKIWLENGTTIERRRSKKTNSYLLNGVEYKAMGQSVPEDIELALGLTPMHFQYQHDAPFWLSLAPGQLSKELNKLTNLESMDRCLAIANSKLRKAKHNVEFTNERLENSRAAATELEWTKAANIRLEKIETLEAKLGDTNLQIENLYELLEKLKLQNDVLAMQTKAAASLDSIMKKAEKIKESRDYESSLSNKLMLLETNHQAAQETKTRLESAALELSSVNLCPTCKQPIQS